MCLKTDQKLNNDTSAQRRYKSSSATAAFGAQEKCSYFCSSSHTCALWKSSDHTASFMAVNRISHLFVCQGQTFLMAIIKPPRLVLSTGSSGY